MHRVVFFQNNVTQYGVLQAFTESLAAAFQRDGVATSIIDTTAVSPSRIFEDLASDIPDCTAGFNAEIPKQSHYESLKIPHLALFVDTVSNFPTLVHADHIIPAFIDEDSCGFLSALGGPKSVFLPHAVDRKLLESDVQSTIRKTRRDLDLVLSGSLLQFEGISEAWNLMLSPMAAKRLFERAEEVLASDQLSPLQAFFELVENTPWFEQELQEKGCNFFDLLQSFETYIRGVDRVRMVQAVSACDIHIFGAKEYESLWKQALLGKKRVFFHNAVPFVELSSVFRRARVVVNSMPFIKRGLHERLLLALTLGASVLTNRNLYIPQAFGNTPAIMNVLSPCYEEANDLIVEAFSDEERRLNTVLKSHATISEHHTWDARALKLQELLPPLLAAVRKKLGSS